MALHWQRVAMPVDSPVYVTRDVLGTANGDLVEVIARREPERRHRLLVVVDDGVAGACPDVAARVAAGSLTSSGRGPARASRRDARTSPSRRRSPA